MAYSNQNDVYEISCLKSGPNLESLQNEFLIIILFYNYFISGLKLKILHNFISTCISKLI